MTNVKVTVEYDNDGKHYIASGVGDNFAVDTEEANWNTVLYSKYLVSNPTTKFTISGIENYTVTVIDNAPIERTARVLGWTDDEATVRRKPTLALIRAAARKAGVDENTEYEIFYVQNMQKRAWNAEVEFRWTE